MSVSKIYLGGTDFKHHILSTHHINLKNQAQKLYFDALHKSIGFSDKLV